MRILSYLACAATLAAAGCAGSGGASGGGSTEGECEALEGAYQLVADEPYSVSGEAPWVRLWAEDDDCRAVVACEGFPERAYDVRFREGQLELSPTGSAARGGHQGLLAYDLTDWKRISLSFTGAGLSGKGSADVFIDYNEEDIWDSFDRSVSLSVEPPEPPELGVSSSNLPWRPISVFTSRPMAELASALLLPSNDWAARDKQTGDLGGVIQGELRFGGNWDDVRGQNIEIGVESSLGDLDGQTVSGVPLEVPVLDIGPAVPAHELEDTSKLASWGYVEPFTEGDCASVGCVWIEGGCDYAGIGGQVDVRGKDELVLAMRLTYGYESPALSRVEVVAEDGTSIPEIGGENWPVQELHEWTYRVSGHARVGFSIEASGYCHRWGGPIIVDRVFAR